MSAENPFRTAFIERLRTKFYEELRNSSLLSGWDPTTIWRFSGEIMVRKRNEITAYLETNTVTLANSEGAMQEIINQILIKELDTMRI
jgi:hypothetical protein